MSLRNDKNMDRRVRVYIIKRENAFILVNLAGGYFPRDDLAEKAIVHFHTSLFDLGSKYAGCGSHGFRKPGGILAAA